MFDFTTVIGVDAGRLEHLRLTFPTWKKFKPEIMQNRLVVFYDHHSIAGPGPIIQILKDHPSVTCCSWPPLGVTHEGTPGDRWNDPQRAKMLSGFIHTVYHQVQTPYWLKLDVDAVATGPEPWIDKSWWIDSAYYECRPAIIAPPWGYSKPADVMMKLDEWVMRNQDNPAMIGLTSNQPLGLVPKPGSSLVRHPRIISWCAFFHTGFTKLCARLATATCGSGKMPVSSQDGFMWYIAERMKRPIVRARMTGWKHCSKVTNIKKTLAELGCDVQP